MTQPRGGGECRRERILHLKREDGQGGLRPRLWRAFALLDANGDGSLSKDEFDKRDMVEVDASFSHLDGNDDGELSRSGWQEARNVNRSSDERMTIWYYYIY